MHAIIEQHIDDLRDLCVRHRVQRLELFGSPRPVSTRQARVIWTSSWFSRRT